MDRTRGRMKTRMITVETYDKKTYDKKSRPSNSKEIFENPRKTIGKPKNI